MVFEPIFVKSRLLREPALIRPATEDDAEAILRLGIEYIHATKKLSGPASSLVFSRMKFHEKFSFLSALHRQGRHASRARLEKQIIDQTSARLLDETEQGFNPLIERGNQESFEVLFLLNGIKNRIIESRKRGYGTPLVVVHGGEVKGFGAIEASNERTSAILFVRSHLRGREVGFHLLKLLLEDARNALVQNGFHEFRTIVHSAVGEKMCKRFGAEIVRRNGEKWAVFKLIS